MKERNEGTTRLTICHTMESENLEFCLWLWACNFQCRGGGGNAAKGRGVPWTTPGLTSHWALGTSAEDHVAQREKQWKEKEKASGRNGALQGSTGVSPSSAIMVPVSAFYFIFSMANDFYTAHVNGDSDPINPLKLSPGLSSCQTQMCLPSDLSWPISIWNGQSSLPPCLLSETPSLAFRNNTAFQFSSFLRTMSSESPPLPPPSLFSVSMVDRCQSLVWDDHLFSL